MRPVAEAAAELLPPGGSLLDLGCGVGSIALWVKRHRPDCFALGVDINSIAVEAAKGNAQTLGLDAHFVVGDLYAPVGGFRFNPRFDVIAITVPWEPDSAYPGLREARDAFVDGDKVMARALGGARDHLNAGGKVVVYGIQGFDEALELAGLRILEQRTSDEAWVYIAEAA